MQSLLVKKQRLATLLTFAGLISFAVLSVALFAPISNATRQRKFANQTATISTATKRRRPDFVPGEVLVRFKQNKAFEGAAYLPVPNGNKGTQAVAAPAEQIQLQIDRFEGSDLVEGLRIARTNASAEDTWKAIAALRARDDVLYAEPNYLMHVDNTPNDPCFPPNGSPLCQFTGLYGMTKIGAPSAWDLTTGSSGIVVGVVDEGIQLTHTDLQANIWTNPSPGSISGISGDLHGYDFINNSGNIPAEPHASHVAGTIGAVGNNGVGVVGVNWTSNLMSLRFIDDNTGLGADADAIRALNYAKQMHDLWISSNHTQGANVRVLNNSYGGAPFEQSFLDAINALSQSDILFVAAAGNDGTNNDVMPHYPSNYGSPNVMAVAATDSSDSLAGFSSFGAHSVLLGAPGVSILSTVPNNSYAVFSGTSMATPHVAGAAALLLAANPNLTFDKVRALLAFNGDLVPSLQGKTLSGRRLNVFKSLQALNENDVIPPGRVQNFQITGQSGRTFNLSWIAKGDDGSVGQASLYDISFIDATTNAVIPLTSVIPAATGTVQTASVNIPYRHTSGTIKLREFDNVGNEGTPNTIQVSVDPIIGDPYVPSTIAPAALSTGGTGLAMNCDDCFKTTSLPFTFPFFGTNYSSITISSNGNIYFTPPTPPTRPNGDADDVPSSVGGLSQFKMISGMWDDLDLRTANRADADIYVVQPDASHVIFRWQGVQFNDGSPINFEIELNSNGTIKTRYGSGNTNLFPVVGISGGEPDVYVIDALTSEQSPINLTNAQSAVFTPTSLTGAIPFPVAQFVGAPYTVPENVAGGRAVITVSRTGDTSRAASVDFSTFDGTAKQLTDYTLTTGTLTWAAGDAANKIFKVPIVDDVYPESDETFTVALSNPVGITLNATNTATITIQDNDQSGPSIPQKRFFALLNGGQETPPNASTATGSGIVLLNSNETSALAGLTFKNLSTAETAAHIHTGAAGVAGAVTFPLPTTNPVIDFSISPTAQQVTDLKAGQQYMNVHSSNFTSGEIRGQLLWNPTLEAGFFVRQHYLDFLGREPDPNGLSFWIGQIHCPQVSTSDQVTDQADVQCFHDRTIGVSNAFYFSDEFHLTAGFVFGMYRAAYGDQQPFPNTDSSNPTEARKLPEYSVFSADRSRVLGGSTLAAQQLAFATQFVGRQEFIARYPASLNTATLFVNAVLATIQSADGQAAAPDSQNLIANYNNAGGGSAGRALVMWHLANDYWNTCGSNPAPCMPNGFGAAVDNRAFIDAEYNRQFALTLYFGYLRRNPDIGGFLFWLGKINLAPVRDGVTQNGLVCSFVTSPEYQARFGPTIPRGNQECQ